MENSIPLIPFKAREKVARLVEIQRSFDAGEADPIGAFLEHSALYRELRGMGLTELQIEHAMHALRTN